MKIYFLSVQEDDGKGMAFYREWMPLELLNCIAVLRQDSIEAKLCTHPELIKLSNSIQEDAKIFVSSSSLDYWQCPKLKITKFIKTCQELSKFNEVYVLGFHGTSLPEYILNITRAKAVVRGEPEVVVRKICNGFPLEEIEGVTFRNKEGIISNSDSPLLDLNFLPVPAYDQVLADQYSYELTAWNRFAVFETSRGCTYDCSFCAKDVMHGKGYRTKNTDQVINEICVAVNKYGFRTGYFMDLNFLHDRERVLQLSLKLATKKLDFKWACDARIDQVDEEILRKMYDAGCRYIAYGIESYKDAHGQSKFKLEFSLEKIIQIIEMTESLGLKSLCYYQVGRLGALGEVGIREDKLTLEMMIKISSSYASVLRFFDFKNKTELKRTLEFEGIFKKDKLDKIIIFYLLRFYFNPSRIIKFLKGRPINRIFKDLLFFMRVVINK